MSPSAERVNAVARLFLPLAVGVFLTVYGVVTGQLALVALAGAALGLPGLSAVGREPS